MIKLSLLSPISRSPCKQLAGDVSLAMEDAENADCICRFRITVEDDVGLYSPDSNLASGRGAPMRGKSVRRVKAASKSKLYFGATSGAATDVRSSMISERSDRPLFVNSRRVIFSACATRQPTVEVRPR